MPKWQCTFFFCGVCVRATTNAKVNRACQRGTQIHTHKRACKQRSQCKWLGREWVSMCARERQWEGVAGWCGVCTHYSHNSRQAGRGSVGKCACSVKCFSKLLKIASKRNNNNVKVICDIVLCIVICPHTDTRTLAHTRRHTLTSVTLCQLLLLLLLFLLFLLSMVGCAQWVHRKK